MITQEQIKILKQVISRLDENILAQRRVLATMLSNPTAYDPLNLTTHVDKLCDIILNYRTQQIAKRKRLDTLENST